MSREKIFVLRGIAIVLIAIGIVLAVTWGSAQFCVGDVIFSTLGLEAWSNGSGGLHYPAVIGSTVYLLGFAVFGRTLPKNTRHWTWGVAFAVLALLAFLNIRFL